MAVAFFLIVIIIYDLDLAALYPGPRWRARVAGIALSRAPPPFSTLFTSPRVPFPLPPTAASATKLIVSPQFTPARRHAQPLLAARAHYSRSWGGERGAEGLAGWRASEGSVLQPSSGQYLSDPLSPVSSPSLPLVFSYIVSHPPDRKAGIPTSGVL